MHLPTFSGLLAPISAVAILACGGDDLVLPTDESPSTRLPSELEIAEGNGQDGIAGTTLGQQVVVQVVDQDGAGLPGQTVNWNVATGAGSATPASNVTDEEGYAAATWTLGMPGFNTLTAAVAGLGVVTFQATANDPAGGGNGGGGGTAEPHHFVFTIPPRDVGEGEWFTVEVTIVDRDGNVVPLNGTEVYLGLFEEGDDNPSNGDLSGDRFEHTVNGVATFNLYIKKDGSYRFLARSDYLPPHLGPYGPELFSNTFSVFD